MIYRTLEPEKKTGGIQAARIFFMVLQIATAVVLGFLKNADRTQ